jgi:hypothetical protein
LHRIILRGKNRIELRGKREKEGKEYLLNFLFFILALGLYSKKEKRISG